jgi:probable HAF family extracellular repeat protein
MKAQFVSGKISVFLAALAAVVLLAGPAAGGPSFQGLGALEGFPGWTVSSTAYAVSADGAVVVGESFWGLVPRTEAVLWTKDGSMEGLGFLPGESSSSAYGISAGGSVVVGFSGGQAFRWTKTGEDGIEGGIMESLGPGSAYGVSADGKVVVGASAREAFRWEDGEMVGLGFLPGGSYSSAQGVSADGTVVVGSSIDSGYEAFIWDETNGMRSLRGVLEALGLENELEGWTLRVAPAISADGRTIVGYGTNPTGKTEAWRAVLGVSVPTVENIIGEVEGLLDSGDLNQGQATALISTLEAAARLLDDGQVQINQVEALVTTGRLDEAKGQALIPACNLLQAFIRQVKALVTSGHLEEAKGQALISAVTSIIEAYEASG